MPSPDPEHLRAKFASMGNLPTLPAAAAEALAVANDPDCTIRQLGNVIHGDASLATSVLKMANSSFYASRDRVGNLQTAIVRLGLREVRNLIVAVGVKSVFFKVPKKLADVRDWLWGHSVLCATLSRMLAEKLEMGDGGEHYTAGLSHDFGKILLAIGLPDLFERLYSGCTERGQVGCQHERDLLGFDHCQIGGWMAQMWKLPDEISQAVECHHEPGQATRQPVHVAVVALADTIALGRAADQSDLATSDAWTILAREVPVAQSLNPTELAQAVLTEIAEKPNAQPAVA